MNVTHKTESYPTFCVENMKEPKKKCLQCGQSFTRLKRHVKTVHEQVRDFECQQCDKAYSMKDDLNKHIKRVHNLKRHKCSVCQNVYSSKVKLKDIRIDKNKV